jgi:hypothetical protein
MLKFFKRTKKIKSPKVFGLETLRNTIQATGVRKKRR